MNQNLKNIIKIIAEKTNIDLNNKELLNEFKSNIQFLNKLIFEFYKICKFSHSKKERINKILNLKHPYGKKLLSKKQALEIDYKFSKIIIEFYEKIYNIKYFNT